MSSIVVITLALAVMGVLLAAQQGGGAAAEEVNKANNPLQPTPALNLQDIYSPDQFGLDRYTNSFLIRGVLPIMPKHPGKKGQIIRATLPINTSPDPSNGHETGLGDLNVFDVFLLKTGKRQFGVGPLLTLPTATDDLLGQGKWQGGLAALVIDLSVPKWLLGGLVQPNKRSK